MPRSNMVIPNSRNSRLMGTPRIGPYRRSGEGASGPGLVTAPVIRGFIGPDEVISIQTPPVWDGTEISTEQEWYLNGNPTGVIGDTYTLGATVDPTDAVYLEVRATNAEAQTSARRSNTITMVIPQIELPDAFLVEGATTIDLAVYSYGYVTEYTATGAAVESLVGSVVTITNAAGDYTLTATATNPIGTAQSEAPVKVVEANEYQNAPLLGGAASGPGIGDNSPTAHTIGFNTVNSGPIDNGDGTFTWDMNPEQALGRSYLGYDLAANHPVLNVGDVIKFTWVVEELSGFRTLCLTASGTSGVSIVTGNDRTSPNQSTTVDLTVTIEDPSYAATFRVGVGPTTNRRDHMRVSNPIAFYENRVQSDLVMTVETSAPAETFTFPATNDGTFDAVIDWGDGQQDTITAFDAPELAHEYANAGVHQIRVSGAFPGFNFNGVGSRFQVRTVESFGNTGLVFFSFRGCNQMTKFIFGTGDFTGITGLNSAFRDTTVMKTFSLIGADMSNVTDMNGTFYNAGIETLQAGDINTTNVVQFGSCFRLCTDLTGDVTISGFDTNSAQSFSSMFRQCNRMETLDVSNLDTSNVANFSSMFDITTQLRSITGIENWDLRAINTTGAFNNFITGGSMTEAQYDGFLANCVVAAQNGAPTGVTLVATNCFPSAAGLASRDILTGTYGWIITDQQIVTTLPVIGVYTAPVSGQKYFFRYDPADFSIFEIGFDEVLADDVPDTFTDFTAYRLGQENDPDVIAMTAQARAEGWPG